MPRTTISIFFSILFVLFVSAPTVISVIEKSFDVSVFFSMNEEENNENEVSKKLELKMFELTDTAQLSQLERSVKNEIVFYLKPYALLSADNTSPPPEQV
ncbi:hypothetical protein [Mangrovimonas aestuarii]|uniref:hypothetical protein n=1 Tax=Mangrovimonas aestuarii TaxID=3018443 RepID=UPI0023793C6C|nr:hypothetical protein [Mangrovimonas aestuarii]